MPSNAHPTITPPDDLLPAQLGIVLVRRPILGHAAATLVSLAERGLLTVTSPPESDPDDTDDAPAWLIGTAPPSGSHHPNDRFEVPLLNALPPAPGPLAFTEDTALDLAPALREFHDGVVKDAVHRGWLRHLHHEQLTRAGEDLAVRTGNFCAALRKAIIAGNHEVLAGHLAYALTFGLVSPETAPAEVLPLVRFANAFVSACSGLPDWKRPHQKHEFPDVGGVDFTRDEWRGMPPGGRSIASLNNTPGLP